MENPSDRGPAELRVDELKTALGIDDPSPRFSWQLCDPTRGAKQTAYEIQVASSQELLRAGKTDVWDSGKIIGNTSVNVKYAGPALTAFTRYFWRVRVWNAEGKQYLPSKLAWWEMGLLSQTAWRGEWIGYETIEEHAVRSAEAQWIASPDASLLAKEKTTEQNFAYRTSITLAKPIKYAALYATADATVSAWVNGAQVRAGERPTPSGFLPWRKYVRTGVTDRLSVGVNTIAIEARHYGAQPEAALPMIATLVVEYADGTTDTFGTGINWKAAVHAASGWQQRVFDDSSWKNAILRNVAGHPWDTERVKALRHEFAVKSPVRSARLYATALGAYEMFVNGKRATEDVLAPGWTDYRETVRYQTYDVTNLVKTGSNVLGALLASGWYGSPLLWYQAPNNYGDTPPALRAQLRVEHNDGSVEWISTNTNWQASTTNILYSEIYDGESQDARLAQPGWNAAGFVAKGWQPAVAIHPQQIAIVAQDYPAIRVERILRPQSVTEPKPGLYVYDFGQNFAGVAQLSVQGRAGTVVRLRHAEVLNPDGTLYTDNLRTAKATDQFVLAGNGVEELKPEFTFHGFRYLEVTGLPSALPKEKIAGLVLHTAANFTARLQTGSDMLNKLWSNILWGQRSNFVGLPTDCPQRDERLGWTADAEVFWKTASYNMDLASFSRKYAVDLRYSRGNTPYYGIYAPGVEQPNPGYGAGWSDAGVIVPWTSWLQTGDTSIIEQNWAAMGKYLDAIEVANSDGLWQHNTGIAFGDWLSPEGKTDQALITTAYWAYDAALMRQMAHATGRSSDEQKYTKMFEKVRAAFQTRFIHDDGFIAGATKRKETDKGGDTQAGYVLALHMNLVPEQLRAAVARKLADKIGANHGLLGTGFLGTPYLLEELARNGQAALAYQLLLNTQYPSWGYMVEHGATTMWERWNGDQMHGDASMNSYNHYAYGAVADWLYRYAAGIDATASILFSIVVSVTSHLTMNRYTDQFTLAGRCVGRRPNGTLRFLRTPRVI
jgi:alpha-L-rhamnosidase